ncbi:MULTISPECIES: heme A synthase [unclassified Colwellia]|uniref:COX15/CtaA family protein n=1 Tax=unclassified Colwellia TaxID=196834 RepID=UPI0015F5A956|nr:MULTISPECIES: COX15/CtaA family protein [unclassified Colwellia]MBA6224318.1 COX15/CtaA family protein [Colwellia sp. MB3u-45]MBA6265850.1 COX15/CtaA family protein [Colwellia sp. MB3u-43]MBA6288458.1 COX15/CtaA family protein [Colwellia sp. MB3u-4]MBA6321530.1 COX15/CtaA family protein [Colwellia sp. MB02u-19]MBA6323702.1 COX15/CtaA family protein [Colwellia sp. MB02u-18]
MRTQSSSDLRKLVFVSILLAIVVVSLGAYARLTHAGLGCPDWPGCYGLVEVPKTSAQIMAAEQAFPERPVEPEKAWNEMIHRYFAGALGLLILIIALMSLKRRAQRGPLGLPILLLIVVTFQAALGMWTVTMKLMPVVVMGHLLGGFTTLCLLLLLYLRLSDFRVPGGDIGLKKYFKFAVIGIFILVAQIGLGGWTSSNYAALTCAELPICQAGWVEQMNFEHAFDLIPPEKESYEFGHLDHASRLTIHVMHRLGAIVTTLYLFWLAIRIYRKAQAPFFKNAALSLGFILSVQVGLGISNVWFSLPLNVAVSHNVVAAMLMMSLITMTYSLKRKT